MIDYPFRKVGIIRVEIKGKNYSIQGYILKLNSNTPIWIVSAILMFVGIILVIHAIINYNDSEIVIEWTTASELDTVGFNLLRGDSENGPYEQINPELLPSDNDSLTGGSYQFLDTRVIRGRIYYYLLEEIEMTGEINQHGPIIVKADNTSKTELLVAFLLLIGSMINGFFLVKDQRKNRGNHLN
jgi:hypothetical protein